MDKLKTLRDLTGISIMECKKALDEAGDDLEKAKTLLSKRGIEIAAKKESRETKSGRIFSYVHHNGKIASLVELFCETDFVAMNDTFKTLGADLAMQVASMDLSEKESLLKSEFIKDSSKTIETLMKETIFALGENIQLGKIVVLRI